MKSILFVCMGNICRSPVAAEVTRSEFARAGVSIEIASAATESYHIGQPADARSIASAGMHGYDLARHRARQISATDFAAFDAVLAMDRTNLRTLAKHCPRECQSRLALFLPFAGLDTPEEVPDPFYGGEDDFQRVIELARRGARGLLSRCAMAHTIAPEQLI